MRPDVQRIEGSGGAKPAEGLIPSFAKAVALTVGLLATSVVVVLVPIVGAILSLTLVPYVASAIGTRLARPGERLPASLTAGIIWSAVETTVLVLIMSLLVETPMGFVMDGIGWAVLMAIWVMNLLFSTLGALHPWKDPFRDYSRT